MSLSNKEKVGRGLEQLTLGLRPFVDAHMSASVPAGTDWVAMYSARESAKHGVSRTFAVDDVRFLLKVVTEEWRVFADHLSRPQSSLASELREVGNAWAHQPSMSSDDTYRALDTIERLLSAINEPSLAQNVAKMRADHQRAAFDEQTQRTVKAAKSTISTPGSAAGTAIKPWRDVISPHRDVATGQFNAAEFAADLHQVAAGQATAPEYTDPRAFFARTYVTGGLRELLERAVRRISGDLNASPVMNLQTQFGGGKTHSMLALYHLFSGTPASGLPQAIQEIVGDVKLEGLDVRRVALVGTHLSPASPLPKPDGTKVRTLWGELAWQLGGRAAYDRIAEADRLSVPPGDALADLIRDHSPAIILIDEWVAYARVLVGKDDLPGGDFASQFTFAQHLTEAVRAIPGAMLVVSIPASDNLDSTGGGSALEVGGANGREALERLQHVVGRTADDWRPATALESFEIVKRRLFEEPDAVARADIAAVARQYVTFYRDNTGQFPRESGLAEYEERIKTAYPIHPELFDRLYEDWSTLEKFQRTRGVLRLMSTVIHALWAAGDSSPLISPGSVPLNAPSVFSELTHYLSDNWKPIVDADIDGDGSTPVHIDAERPSFGARALTRRIARAIFLGSAPTLGTAHKGLERQRLWLGVAVPGDTTGHFGDALEVLSQRATYLYSESGRFWYDTAASITRQATDRADMLREVPEEVWAEVVRRLNLEMRKSRGAFAGVHVAPLDTGDVPDTDEVRLVVVHPKFVHGRGTSSAKEFAESLLTRVGNGQRTRRNMVVLVAADAQRYDELEAAVREYLAWSQIAGAVVELDLTPQQRQQAEGRAKQADETVDSRLTGTYISGLVPSQADPQQAPGINFERIAEGQGSLAERVTEKLRRGQELSATYAAANVRMALDGPLTTVWAAGHVTFGTLWDLFSRYPYLDRLRDRRILEDAVLNVGASLMWQVEGFALALGYDETTDRYDGLWIPGDSGEPVGLTDSALLVRADRALEQRAAETLAARAAQEATAQGSASISALVGGSAASTTALDAAVLTATSTVGASDSVEGGTPVGLGHTQYPNPVAVPLRAVQRRFFGSKDLNPERYASDFSKVTQEVIQHLAGVPGVTLEVRLEITAVVNEGFDEAAVRTVRENAMQLKFEQYGFEES